MFWANSLIIEEDINIVNDNNAYYIISLSNEVIWSIEDKYVQQKYHKYDKSTINN